MIGGIIKLETTILLPESRFVSSYSLSRFLLKRLFELGFAQHQCKTAAKFEVDINTD